MKARNEDLRRGFDEEASRLPRSERGCAEVETILRVIEGDATAAERAAFADHVLVCSDCAEEYRAARSAGELFPPAARDASPGALPSASRLPPWLAAAAAVFVLLALSVVVLRQPRRESPALLERGPAPATSAVEPADGSTLTEPPAKLSWAPVDGADGYRVVVYDAESTPLWQAGQLAEAQAALPEELRERLRGGGDFSWRVETRRRGEHLSSVLHRFSLRPPSGSGR